MFCEKLEMGPQTRTSREKGSNARLKDLGVRRLGKGKVWGRGETLGKAGRMLQRPPFKLVIVSRGTDLYSLGFNCYSRTSPGPK